MKLSREECLILNEAVEYIGVELRTDYSGRVMYGSECIGLVTDNYSVVDAVASLVKALMEDNHYALAAQFTKGARTDSMGLGSIVYWPHLHWDETVQSGEDYPDDDEDIHDDDEDIEVDNVGK